MVDNELLYKVMAVRLKKKDIPYKSLTKEQQSELKLDSELAILLHMAIYGNTENLI